MRGGKVEEGGGREEIRKTDRQDPDRRKTKAKEKTVCVCMCDGWWGGWARGIQIFLGYCEGFLLFCLILIALVSFVIDPWCERA